MAIRAIIFDIDGVLADSRKAVVHNTKELLREFGFRFKEADVGGMSSAHSAETVLLQLAPALENDSALLKRMLERLSELTYENLHLVKPTAIAGAVPELAKKYRLAAASNRKASAIRVLEQMGIARHFRAVVNSADAPPKPDPKMLVMALGKLDVKPSEALFVGDNNEDRLAGEAAGVRFFMLDGNKKEDCEKFLASVL